jgi:hypothetical protein
MRAEGRLKETEINKRPILRWGRKKKRKNFHGLKAHQFHLSSEKGQDGKWAQPYMNISYTPSIFKVFYTYQKNKKIVSFGEIICHFLTYP